MRYFFDVPSLYYLAQYLPVARVLRARGFQTCFVFYRQGELDRELERAAVKEMLDVHWVASGAEAASYYLAEKPDWVIFGNGFAAVEQINEVSRTALLYHGIGLKECYYDEPLSKMTVRFVEGEYRLRDLQARYPGRNFVAAGFAKLDPLFNGSQAAIDLTALGLNPDKPTILYAPTFYPSSIEHISAAWPEQFSAFNIIIKPHYFSWALPQYAAQRQRFADWALAPNTYVCGVHEHSLLPYFKVADVLVSEASSALFEFAALDKPIIWCDFLKLRWSYRGPLRFRLRRRMDQKILSYADIGAHVAHYKHLYATITDELAHPDRFAAKRRQYTSELIGVTDGHCAERIADYLQK